MKRVVLCFDGTWNTPANPALPPGQQVETNVSRFYRSVAAQGTDGVAQLAWYNPGVGTGRFDHITGGAFGVGLDEHILSGYRFLVENYVDGDDLFVLGFSRGAYAARSLVGMLRNCGLVRPSFASWQVGVAYGIYRTREDGPDSAVARAFRSTFARAIPVQFLGVWDTVGALGIPLPEAQGLDRAFYEFHDTQLSKIVQAAYQAVALDEHREDFRVTLWEPTSEPGQTLEQRWFVGSHSDVGGGYLDRGLSDLTLRWMQGKAAEAGLGLTPVAAVSDGWRGPVHDSYADFLGGFYADTHLPFYRPVFSTQFGHEVVDATIDLRRAADPGYRPPNPGLPPLAG